MRFRIYYGDGSTYSGDPFHAPRENVQCIAQEDEAFGKGWRPIRSELTRKGNYCWHPNLGWVDHTDAGLIRYLVRLDGPKYVIFGDEIARADYWRIVEKMNQEGLGDGR